MIGVTRLLGNGRIDIDLIPSHIISNTQVVTWRGHFGAYIYTIIQKYHHHLIKEQDVTIEKDPSFKEDPDTHYAFLSQKELADALNKHLDRIYG